MDVKQVLIPSITGLNELIHSLSNDFSKETSLKQTTLDTVRGSLRTATKELADCRKQTQTWKDKINELQEAQQKSRNLEKALEEEDRVDCCHGQIYPTRQGYELNGNGSVDGNSSAASDQDSLSTAIEADPPTPPEDDTPQTLLQLRRMAQFYKRSLKFLTQRLQNLQEQSVEREGQCRRIVAKCCEVKEDEVDGMLDSLVAAVEADGQEADVTRIANFLHKTRE